MKKLYTISEVSEMIGILPHTLRYYDKEGLLPPIHRIHGRRMFTEEDVEWLRSLSLLKSTGMPLKDIRKYRELYMQGESSIEERRIIILNQKEALKVQIRQLEDSLKILEEKEASFMTALLTKQDHYK